MRNKTLGYAGLCGRGLTSSTCGRGLTSTCGRGLTRTCGRSLTSAAVCQQVTV